MQKTGGLNETPGGFDVVIGNPPYVESRSSLISTDMKNKYQNQVKLDHGEVAEYITKGADLLIYFFPRTHTILSNNGIVCLIIENAWLNTNYGIKASRFLMNRFEYISIIDSQFKHFDKKSANINTNISFLRKNHNDPKVGFYSMKKKGEQSIVEFIDEYKFSDNLLIEMKWGTILCSQSKILKIFDKIFKKSSQIDQSFYSIGQGINEAENVYISKELKEKFSIKNNTINTVFKEYKYIYDNYDYFLYHCSEKNNKDIAFLKSINKNEFLSGKEIKRKYPSIIMPRGIGEKHFAGMIIHKAFSNSFVDVYVDTQDEEKRLNIWLFCNSSLFFLYREISGRKNLGGGLLKSEASDIKSIPLYFPIATIDVIKKIMKTIGEPINLIERLTTDVQKEIDCLVFKYFSILEDKDFIISELIKLFRLRYDKAKT